MYRWARIAVETGQVCDSGVTKGLALLNRVKSAAARERMAREGPTVFVIAYAGEDERKPWENAAAMRRRDELIGAYLAARE